MDNISYDRGTGYNISLEKVTNDLPRYSLLPVSVKFDTLTER